VPAYCIFDVLEITDADTMERYRAAVRTTVQNHGGRYLVIGGNPQQVEGDVRATFPVIIEFPSLEAARRWYDSPEYAPLLKLRLESTRGRMYMAEGL
jgi:uncharacterized protein (DUF1330 family)